MHLPPELGTQEMFTARKAMSDPLDPPVPLMPITR